MFAIYYFLNCFGTCRRRSSPASNKFWSLTMDPIFGPSFALATLRDPS